MNKSLEAFLNSYIQAMGYEDLEFIIIVDTSESMDQSYLERVLDEVRQIARTFKIAILVLYVDFKYRGCQLIEVGGIIELSPVGGGGTSYIPGFVYIGEQHFRPDIVLYFTDGRCPHFPDKPDYLVAWAQMGDEYFNPPFGSLIQMSKN